MKIFRNKCINCKFIEKNITLKCVLNHSLYNNYNMRIYFKIIILLLLFQGIVRFNKSIRKFNKELVQNYLNVQKYLNLNFNRLINNKIRLGIYTYSLKNGGTQRITALLLNYIIKINLFDIYIYSQKSKEDNEYYIPSNNKRTKIKDYKVTTLIKKIKKNRINVLIYQFPYYKEINALNNLKSIKIIFYQHYSLFYWIYYNYEIFKKLYKSYKKSKYIISLIPLENQYLFKKWGINSILMENFITYDYKSIIPSNLSSKTIIMIGRGHDKMKRFELGIMALKNITKEIPECQLLIIADIKDFSVKTDNITNLIYAKNIIFPGYTSLPEIYYKNASLHIFTSISESFGLVLCETKLYGIPSILLGLDYTTISKGGTIIIYDDKAETIAKEAIKILKNDNYRKRLGKEARRSMKKFNNDLLSKKWIKLILSIFNEDMHFPEIKELNNSTKIHFLKLINNQLALLNIRKTNLTILTINNFENFTFLESIN